MEIEDKEIKQEDSSTTKKEEKVEEFLMKAHASLNNLRNIMVNLL